MVLGSFDGRLGRRHTSALPHLANIVALGGLELCDG